MFREGGFEITDQRERKESGREGKPVRRLMPRSEQERALVSHGGSGEITQAVV